MRSASSLIKVAATSARLSVSSILCTQGVSSEVDFLLERYKEEASVNVRPIRPWLRLFLFIFTSSDQSARLP